MIPQNTRTCVFCGRHAATGRDTVLGWAGPHCARRYAALPALLQEMGVPVPGAEILIPGRLENRHLIPDSDEHRNLDRRLFTVGLSLALVSYDAETRTGRCVIRVRRRNSLRTSIESYAQRRARFAETLRAGSAARRAGETS